MQDKFIILRMRSDIHYLQEIIMTIKKLIEGPDEHFEESSLFMIMNPEKILKEYHDITDEGIRRSFYLSNLRTISRLMQRISNCNDGVKDSNPNFPWETIEELNHLLSLEHFSIEALEHLCLWFMQDLGEMKKRLATISYKQQILLQRTITTNLTDKQQTLMCLYDNINFGVVSEQHIAGMGKIRAVVEPFLDYKKIQRVEKYLLQLDKMDANTKQGREGILILLQQIGENLGHLSYSTRVKASQLPCMKLKALRNCIAHAWDLMKKAQQLKKMIQLDASSSFIRMKQEILAILPQTRSLLAQLKIDVDSIRHNAQKGTCNLIPLPFAHAPFELVCAQDKAQLKELQQELHAACAKPPLGKKETLNLLDSLFTGKLPVPEVDKERKIILGTTTERGNIEKILGDEVRVKNRRGVGDALLPTYPEIIQSKITEQDLGSVDVFLQEVEAAPPLAHVDYVYNQLELLAEAILTIQSYTNDLIRNCAGNPDAIKAACRADSQYHYAVLFQFTVIGQCVQNLRTKEDFCTCASIVLRLEFEALRSIRNSLMHGKSVLETGSLLSFIKNDLVKNDLQNDAARAYDSSVYVSMITEEIDKTLKRIRQFRKTNVLIGYPIIEELNFQRRILLNDLKIAVSTEDVEKIRLLLDALEEPIENEEWYAPIFTAQALLKIKSQLFLKDIYEIQPQIMALVNKYHLKITALFGNIAKYGNAIEDNESGILVEFIQGYQPVQLANFKIELQALLRMRLLCVTENDILAISDDKTNVAQVIQSWKKEFSFDALMQGYKLFDAVEQRDEAAVREVLKLQPKLDINILGYTPLHSALHCYVKGRFLGKSYDIAKLLLAAGADPNIWDKHGNTCLHYAVDEGDPQQLTLLHAYRADLNAKSKSGMMPIELIDEEADYSAEMQAALDTVFPELQSAHLHNLFM